MSAQPEQRTASNIQAGRAKGRDLLFGKGAPRLPLASIFATALWAGLIWLLYPYAITIASWEGVPRLTGLGLLLFSAFAAYKCLRSLGRICWHVGIVWLLALMFAVLFGLTLAEGSRNGASTPAEWSRAGTTVAMRFTNQTAQMMRQLQSASIELVLAVTLRRPFWLAPPVSMATPGELALVDKQGDAIIASQFEPTGITRGALVLITAGSNELALLRVAPGSDQAAQAEIEAGSSVLVIGGPVILDEQPWWQVSDAEQMGWYPADLLVLVSR